MREGIQLLEELLVAKSNTREKRSLALLRDPLVGGPKSWPVYLPQCFNAALDIAQTQRVVNQNGVKTTVLEWTQGSGFAFSSGDIIYDVKEAYLEWGEAVQHIGFCLEVISAVPASPQQKNQPRYPGAVVLRVSRPIPGGTTLEQMGQVEVSQDEFVRFLVSGEGKELSTIIGRIV